MSSIKKIQEALKKFHEKIRDAEDVSEEDLRIAFVRSGILEALGILNGRQVRGLRYKIS